MSAAQLDCGWVQGDAVGAPVPGGAQVVVQGLWASVRVAGADSTLDLLAVTGFDGVDSITWTAAAQALMVLQRDP